MKKMMPIGPLMIEHRLIERMLAVAREELERFWREKRINPGFVMELVDFIRLYADRCHHGKEEDILFRELAKKPISEEHRGIVAELVKEHQWARQQTRDMVEATRQYEGGQEDAYLTVTARLSALVDFYPRHIEKEDQHFFLPVMRYFSQEEKDRMLQEGVEFDSTLIHAKYRAVVEEAERKQKKPAAPQP
jgi:hemerythrin-like domain-containing protein